MVPARRRFIAPPDEPRSIPVRSTCLVRLKAFRRSIRRMKVGEFSAHGFRAAFRDWAVDEAGFRETPQERP